MPELTRRQKWTDLDTDQKVNAAGDDLDGYDGAFKAFRLELRSIRNVMVGLLISVSTGAVLLAVNLVASG